MGLMGKKSGDIRHSGSPTDTAANGIKLRLAVPSMLPGGLKARRSGHFGRCECFTLVDVDENGPSTVNIINNPPHQDGGCLGPVNLLASHGANALIVQGIGMRPLIGFREAGIAVFLGTPHTDVLAVVNDFLAGNLEPISDRQACGG